MRGSVMKDGGRGKEENQSLRETESEMEGSQTRPSETEGSVNSSEQLADQYRGIIGRHPRSIYRHIEDVIIPKGGDIETCTTGPRFLPRQDYPAQERVGEAPRPAIQKNQIG
jgi:hypothetical protein